MAIKTTNPETSVTLKYTGFSTSYSKVKPDATAEQIYDTAVAINTLQRADKALKEIKRNSQYTICLDDEE